MDWLYRDLERVQRSWTDARAGRFSFHSQAGHPLGVPDFTYAGEVALGVILSDPSGDLAALKSETSEYPEELAEALVHGLWEARFLVENARKALGRADAAYTAGCLFRVVLLCAHALHGRAGRWLVNEKGAVSAAGRLPVAPAGFEARAQAVLGRVGTSRPELERSVDAAEAIVDATSLACGAASS